jgi:hypothetical protein
LSEDDRVWSVIAAIATVAVTTVTPAAVTAIATLFIAAKSDTA